MERDAPKTENQKSAKSKNRKRRVVRYLNMDRLGDLKLAEFFFWRGIWRKVQWTDDADFLFHILEQNICWSEVKDKVVNKIPGVTFLSGKQEHAYAFKKFTQLHNLTQEDLRFPETFILPEELKLYLETHRVAAAH